MTSEGNVQYSSGQSMMNPINLGGALSGPLQNMLAFPGSQSSPQSSSMPSGQGSHINQASTLKLSNLPMDITPREATAIFSLVSDDVSSVTLQDQAISVQFKNPNTCVTAGKLLDGKYIFGNKYAPVKVDYDNIISLSGTTGAFEDLRLSNSGISPPSSHQSQQTSHNAPQPAGQHGFENFQKRSSVGNQRSRFLFSDPFSGSITPTNPASGSIDLSDLTGKSLLFSKSSDGREYDGISRDPWGSQSQGNLGFASNPQTPGLSNVPNSYDWGTPGPANAGPNSASAQPTNPLQPPHSSQLPQSSSSAGQQGQTFSNQVAGDRRRTSSFFNGPTVAPNSSAPQTQNSLSQVQSSTSDVSATSQNPGSQQSQQPRPQSQQQTQSSQQQQSPQQQPQTVAAIISQGPTQQSNGSLPSLSIPSSTGNRSGPNSSTRSSNPPSAGTPQNGIATTPTSGARNPTKDVPDLSLLARVPPPANPADQNPPCNTLYVGNLPPDATEAELRSLFAPQKGFRRLSFRTKNQSSNSSNGSSSHNHGPMCFVEFEDVAHATIALAELYGRALPRPNGSNGKGGIRLSFSKNPLGVRGPGNPRRTSANPPASSNGTSGGNVGSYGYSNYH